MNRVCAAAVALPVVALPLPASPLLATPPPAPIEVVVDGLKSTDGRVVVTVCPKALFLQSCPWHASVPAGVGTVVVNIPAVPPGRYAVQVFHDVNGNGAMDTYWFGLPKEPFGFSNDGAKRISRPNFDRSAIQHGTTPQRVSVTVRAIL